jgi:hypothetical protein
MDKLKQILDTARARLDAYAADVNASGELPGGCRASYHAEPIAPASAGLDAVAVTVRVTFPNGATVQAPGLYGYRRCYAAAYARAAVRTARQYIRLHRAAPAAGDGAPASAEPTGDGGASADPARVCCPTCQGRGGAETATARGTWARSCPNAECQGGTIPAPASPLSPIRWTDGSTPNHLLPMSPYTDIFSDGITADLYEVTVPSESRAGVEYRVTRDGTGWHCTCPHHRFRGATCKHIRRARLPRSTSAASPRARVAA